MSNTKIRVTLWNEFRHERKHDKSRPATPTPRRVSMHGATDLRRSGWDKSSDDASDETYVGTPPRPRQPQYPLGAGLQHNGLISISVVANSFSPYGASDANR